MNMKISLRNKVTIKCGITTLEKACEMRVQRNISVGLHLSQHSLSRMAFPGLVFMAHFSKTSKLFFKSLVNFHSLLGIIHFYFNESPCS